MKRIYCLKFLVLAAFLAVSLPAPATVNLDHIVAVVEDDVILSSELEERVRAVKQQLKEQGAALPPDSVLEKQVLDRLILTKLQVQMAENTGIRVDDETLNRTISNIAAENQLSLNQFREILEADGYSYHRFREDIRQEILLSRLRQRQVDNQVMVTDREIENFLMNQQHQGGIEKEYRIAHILIAAPESADENALKETGKLAETLLEQIRNGADIRALAGQYSDGKQVDLGWRKYSQVPTLFADLVPALKEGDSEMVRSPSGFHIIQLQGVRDSEEIVITQTRARHILLRPNEITSETEVRSRLETLRNRILSGDDFADVARGNSEDTVSAANGGDLGWSSPGELVPEFEAVMNELEPGEISEPFQTQFGWHILQVLDRRQHDNTEEIRRARAREVIWQRKVNEARESWLQQMRDDAYVEYRLGR